MKSGFISLGIKVSLMVFFLILISGSVMFAVLFSSLDSGLITKFSICVLLSGLITSVIVFFYIRRTVIQPVNELKTFSDKLFSGSADGISMGKRRDDEIGFLRDSLETVSEDIACYSEMAQKITEGDFSDNNAVILEKDLLGKNLYRLFNDLKTVKRELNKIMKAVMEGNVCKRGDTSSIKSSNKEIIEGVNYILDCFVNILDCLDLSIIISDKEYRTKFANKNAIEGVCTDRNEIIDKECYRVFDCDKSICKLETCVRNNKKESFEEYGAASGLDLYTEITPFKDEDRNVIGVIEVSTDITELKKVQKVVMKQLDYQKIEIQKFIDNLNNFAKGNLNINFFQSESDEDTREIAENFDRLNKSLSDSTKSIKLIIDEVADILSRMANKNFSVEIEREYVGDFVKLKYSINNIIEQFNNILLEINTAAEQVGSGAEQVASSSQNLSQGASEQAGSVEEIAATVSQVAGQSEENAENAIKANELSLKARTDAQNGNQQMNNMLCAMDEIKESSQSISNIIKVIDEIAFQTNILALNAAVEAARAGEHGKGFAVVAEEVRNLAARSAQAAKETTDLIDNSIVKVQEGYKIANETAEALKKIVEGASNTVEIVEKIAEASKQQTEAISEINKGIEQISGVTQSNTATAEESASASEQMSAQAQMLKELIQEFRLAGGNMRKFEDKGHADEKDFSEMLKTVLDNDHFGKY